jgi:hypothetical protein
MKALTDPVDLTEYAATRAAEIAAAQQRHPSGVVVLTPFTGIVADVARFIAEHRLPEGDLGIFTDRGVVVDLTGRPHVSGDVRIWADALNTEVQQNPEVQDGRLWNYYEARGYMPNLTSVRVVARSPISEAVR